MVISRNPDMSSMLRYGNLTPDERKIGVLENLRKEKDEAVRKMKLSKLEEKKKIQDAKEDKLKMLKEKSEELGISVYEEKTDKHSFCKVCQKLMTKSALKRHISSKAHIQKIEDYIS